MRPARSAAALLVAASVSACSGTHAALPVAGSTTARATGNVTLSFTIPAARGTTGAHRRAQFVSPSTASGTITVGGTTTELDLGTSSPNCATVTDGRACTVTVAAPIGSDTFTLVLYNGAYDTMTHLHTGTAVGAAKTTETIVEGSANVAPVLVVGGIPAYADVSASGLVGGTASMVPLTVTVYDASHNAIVAPASYVDASGNAAPITVALRTTTTQLILHDGVQSGTSITVAGPGDAPTAQLVAPATILGAMLDVTNASSAPLPTLGSTDSIAVGGALVETLLAAAMTYGTPDYQYVAASSSAWLPGAPNGFVASEEATGTGEIGVFDASTETFATCTYSGTNVAAAPLPGGVAVAFNAVDNVSQPPLGVQFIASSALTGGACPATNTYTENSGAGTAAYSQALAYDTTSGDLFEGENSGSSGIYAYDTFAAPTLSGNTAVQTVASVPRNLFAAGGTKYFLTGTSATIWTAAGTAAATAQTNSGSTFGAITARRADGVVYALDTTNKRVWFLSGGTFAAYTPANAFTIALTSTSFGLAIGPDGVAYTDDGASNVQSVSPGGTVQSVSLPNPPPNTSQSGAAGAIVDGGNGFVYVFYNDGAHNGTENVFRLSH